MINKYSGKDRVVALKLPRGLRRATVERLRAHTLASRAGVTLGGQSFERGAFDGRLHGSPRRTRLKLRKRSVKLAVPAASAALITARR